MTALSIVIVSYNSAKTISHCLESIRGSTIDQELIELIIVDNDSSDHTVDLLNRHYPDYKLIVNERNLGFGAACNIGADLAKSEYLLFINPDTLLDHQALELLVAKARSTQDQIVIGGALYDGRNNYLPESGRRLPTLKSSIARILRIDHLFKKWSYYIPQQGNEAMPVKAITGALFWINKQLFHSIAGFDERFFLYGEDLDLCLRLQSKGISIELDPAIKAIHFKGESGARTWNRNFHFYDALRIYAEKHFSLNMITKYGLKLVVRCLSVLTAFVFSLLPKLIDVIKCGSILLLVSLFWSLVYHQDIHYFNWYQVVPVIIIISILFVLVLSVSGHYSPAHSSHSSGSKIISSTLAATSIIIIYALLPEDLRFSRSAILIGAVLSSIVFVNGRINNLKPIRSFFKTDSMSIGEAIMRIFPNTKFTSDIANSAYTTSCAPLIIDDLDNAHEASHILYYNSALDTFFNSDLSFQTGYTFEQFSMFRFMDPQLRKQRRCLDILMAVISFIALLPMLIISKSRSIIVDNIKRLLLGKSAVIGDSMSQNKVTDRPYIGTGVVSLKDCEPYKEVSSLSYHYTLHYSISKDLYYCITNFKLILNKLCNDIEN